MWQYQFPYMRMSGARWFQASCCASRPGGPLLIAASGSRAKRREIGIRPALQEITFWARQADQVVQVEDLVMYVAEVLRKHQSPNDAAQAEPLIDVAHSASFSVPVEDPAALSKAASTARPVSHSECPQECGQGW